MKNEHPETNHDFDVFRFAKCMNYHYRSFYDLCNKLFNDYLTPNLNSLSRNAETEATDCSLETVNKLYSKCFRYYGKIGKNVHWTSKNG